MLWWSVLTDEYGRLPALHPRQGRLSLGHGPTPPRLSVSAVVCTRSTWLRWANPHVPLPSVSGPWPKLLLGSGGDTRHPMEPWTGAIIGGDVDDAVEKVAHVALTAFC
jgi:hypothetical protein